MEAQYVLVYGQGNADYKGRVYVLYTGSHYDPLVGVNEGEENDTDKQVRIFALGDEVGQVFALDVARVEQQKAEEEKSKRRRKVLKCDGCGALCDDNDAF